MQALELNLATRPFRNNTLIWLSLVLSLLLLGVLSIWNRQTHLKHQLLYDDLQARLSELRAEASELDRRAERARAGIAKHDVTMLETQSQRANEFIRWKAFSWTRLFNLLQQIQPHNVQMSSIRPVFYQNRRSDQAESQETEAIPVSVEGVARSLQDFIELERALVADPHFDRIEPEATDTEPTTNETVFSLRFLYTPRLPEEKALEAVEDLEELERADPGDAEEQAGPADPAASDPAGLASGVDQAQGGSAARGRRAG